MNFLTRWFRKSVPATEPESTRKERVLYALRQSYAGVAILPWGALARVADTVGCTPAYVGQIAREHGWRTLRSKQ